MIQVFYIYYYYIMAYNNNINNVFKTFSIVDFPKDGLTHGKFNATSPKKGADLAFTELLKYINNNDKSNDPYEGKFVVFTIINIDSEKEYKYIGNRIRLENPVKKNNVTYYYKNVIGKYNPELDKIQ